MRQPSAAIIATAIAGFLVICPAGTTQAAEDDHLKAAIEVIDEFQTPGLEAELSGIYPHPTDENLYYVVANLKPPYRYGQEPKLPEEYRGKLLTVDRDGTVLRAVPIADDDFGGLAFAEGRLYVALTNGAEIRRIDPETGATDQRIPLPSPAGGLGYDAERGVMIAQLYVGHPNLAVINLETGSVVETLWSDESAMGLAKIDGDWLCTWASGWDPGSFSELRVLDQSTGKVRSRVKLDGVHSSLAPARLESGRAAFMSLVTTDSYTGETVIRRYGYVGETRTAALN